MKKLFCICFFMYGMMMYTGGGELLAAGTKHTPPHKQKKAKMTRGDVKVIEASENIRYLSQKIAKEYLFLYRYPQNEAVKKSLYGTLAKLGENLKVISAVTNDEDTNNILDFLAYSKEQILDILTRKPSHELLVEMLDYSDTLQEGAESIGKTYAYTFSKEEKMLVVSKNISFLLERIIKYYMALYNGYNTRNNHEKLQESVRELTAYLAKLNRYAYPEKIRSVRREFDRVWQRDKEVISQAESFLVPNLLFDSVVYLEEKIDVLARYHSQNL